jgi:hypothetical protein
MAWFWHNREQTMQKPNYQFEKRRKEMEKKARKEAKRRQKMEANTPATPGTAVNRPTGPNPNQ